ncbi:DNA methyltransferase [Hellea balneolensis]|uniref:DNA methyltransferase n=1 Tax=Hellea balneolensis TaxID=287478 RepID=UPI000418A434|nr:DNA methyltransferase [Hellea balneolensis]
MKATEILEELEKLVAQPFDPAEFAFQFIECFPQSSKTTLARLRKGSSNKSDVPGAILQRNNIHILAAQTGEVEAGLRALKDSPQTAKQKAKFILVTDGETLQAENIKSGAFIACDFADLPDKHFGFLLPLAGISTNKEILDNPIDIKATSRLDKLYQELAANNPDWTTPERREDFNHFMAQLIFCFYAEDTSIFQIPGLRMVEDRAKTYAGLFTETVRERSNADGSGTQEAIRLIFEAMNIDTRDGKGSARLDAGLPGWADNFPYVNGGLFGTEDDKKLDVPHFTQMARSYLIAAGELKWTDINPDIFGSMIQAVADDEERGSLGMHYTSVPNILKVLNPLFLDSLEEQLERAGDNPQQLGKLRKRMTHIRVFDPACGSGNFLVIAYKRMRDIEHRSNIKSGRATRLEDGENGEPRWSGQPSEISLRNFRGIEIKPFAAEVARLALIIAEYQCDEVYIGQKQADIRFLPLDKQNWIVRGNALRLDWLGICPPAGEREVKVHNWTLDLEGGEAKQKEIAFENEGGETYICGNPPYLGRKYQSDTQKSDLKAALQGYTSETLSLDFVAGWFGLASDYILKAGAKAVFVTTNSLNQGLQTATFWRPIYDRGVRIFFVEKTIKWSNSASNNAGVTVNIIGLSEEGEHGRIISGEESRDVDTISPYLTAGSTTFVSKSSLPISSQTEMRFGNHPYYANELMLKTNDALRLVKQAPGVKKYLKPLYGSQELVSGSPRQCIWILPSEYEKASMIPQLSERFEKVRQKRLGKEKDKQSLALAETPFQFREQVFGNEATICVPIVSSENRPYLPVDLLPANARVHNKAFALYDAPIWNLSLVASRLHWVWIGTVCGRLEMRFSYSNTLGWNTFPVPKLTQEHKADLTHAAENILLAREAHFPSTIADLYKPDTMPENLRAAHAENDRILEEIYIGRPFKNDTERLEKLFEMYAAMTKGKAA